MKFHIGNVSDLESSYECKVDRTLKTESETSKVQIEFPILVIWLKDKHLFKKHLDKVKPLLAQPSCLQ